jgi:hypothetical protein
LQNAGFFACFGGFLGCKKSAFQKTMVKTAENSQNSSNS